MKLKNVDVYVTGSNSKMLSSDIITEFRGRGDELRLYPLSYPEILEASFDCQRFIYRQGFCIKSRKIERAC